MVDELVLKTVKKMYHSGLNDEAVRSSLADLGLSRKEQDEVMAAAKGIPVEQLKPKAKPKAKPAAKAKKKAKAKKEELGLAVPEPLMPEEVPEEIAKKTAEKVKKTLEEREAAAELRETTTAVSLEEQRREIGEVKEQVQKIPKGLAGRMALLEKEIKALKAQNSALQTLLKKILEANREIILRLKK